ncbi:MAG: hypothetical protein SGCHY_002805 [Lobulomycetales sp.]
MASVVQVKTAFRRAPEPPAAVASVDEDGKSKKRRRGQNKARRFPAIRDPLPLCANLSGRGCCEGTLNAEGLCAETSGTHDIKLYLEQKGRDIGPSCHLFDTFGFCKFGVKCRFAASHLDENLNNMKKDDFHSPVSAGYAILSSDQLSQIRKNKPKEHPDVVKVVQFSQKKLQLQNEIQTETQRIASIKRQLQENPAAHPLIKPENILQTPPGSDTSPTVETEAVSDASQNVSKSATDVSENSSKATNEVSENSSKAANEVNENSSKAANEVSENVVKSANEVSENSSNTAMDVSQNVVKSANEVSENVFKSEPEASENSSNTAMDVSQNVVESATETSENVVKSEPEASENVVNSATEAAKDERKSATDAPPKEPLPAQATDVLAELSKKLDAHIARLDTLNAEFISTRLEPRAKKRHISFKGKTYLAPLTTGICTIDNPCLVGNLPFRRVCKRFGVDVTCGEMAMTDNLVKGQQMEWSLTRRHPSEDIFGVQVCASDVSIAAAAGAYLNEYAGDWIDFVDLNLGCPIDSVVKTGAGSGLMERKGRLDSIISGLNYTLGEIPLTLKMRTGIHAGYLIAYIGILDNKRIAHNLVTKYHTVVDAITLHGRSQRQRYSRTADWGYIRECAGHATDASPDFCFLGNGDVYTYADYERCMAEGNVGAVMIGRSALQKPWIFQEIKEKRVIDMRSSQRFDMLKEFVNYGLEHWGSDTVGVHKTRRFLCEWLSHLYRYVPVGLLEEGYAQAMNHRPPPYTGRDELETLMASPNSADWVKISELLLGPAGEFQFTPKHKSNSWE